ncbi:hypothetical protein [Flavobacterium sp.]
MTETKEYFCCNMKKEESQRSMGQICLPITRANASRAKEPDFLPTLA